MSQSFIKKPDNGPHSALAGLGVLSAERTTADPVGVLRRIVAWRDNVHAGRVVRGSELEALIEEARSALAAPAPSAPADQPSPDKQGHFWHDYGKLAGESVSWCSVCDALAFTGREPNTPCGAAASPAPTEEPRTDGGEVALPPELNKLREALTNLVNTFHEGRAIPQDSRSEGYVLAAVEAAEEAIGGAAREPELSAICAACGKSYGEHNYSDCLNGMTRFKPFPASSPASATEEPIAPGAIKP